MLISDSLPLLWLCYVVLALIVLVTGYFAFSFLPRLPRWVLVGLVAGALLMPAHFTIPGPKEELGYAGWAPALVVTTVGLLQHKGGQVMGAGLWLLLGMIVAGAVCGWLTFRRGNDDDDRGDGQQRRSTQSRTRHSSSRERSDRRRSGDDRHEPSLRR